MYENCRRGALARLLESGSSFRRRYYLGRAYHRGYR